MSVRKLLNLLHELITLSFRASTAEIGQSQYSGLVENAGFAAVNNNNYRSRPPIENAAYSEQVKNAAYAAVNNNN